MAGLKDVAPLTETVAGLTVRGVSARGIASLIARFDEINALLAGRELNLGLNDILRLAPDAIAAIIAAGLGFPGDEEQETLAADLPVEMQVDFLTAIVRLTAPNGLAAVVEKVTALGGVLNSDRSTPAPATKSRKPSIS